MGDRNVLPVDKTEPPNKDIHRYEQECGNDASLGGYDSVSIAVIHQISDTISIIAVGFTENRTGNNIGEEKFDRISEMGLGKVL